MSNLSIQNSLVTVYIPTYNRVDLLKRAVESVRNQTYKNLEIIIVDDCSTDGSQEYLTQLAKEDQRVRYFLKEKNSGACVSRNIAIENATGEFITGLDDDDYFLENRIQYFINHKDLLNEYIFLFTVCLMKNGENSFSQWPFSKILPKKVKSSDLLFSNVIGNQCFIKTEDMKKYGVFNKKLTAWQDFDVWYNILKTTNKKAIKMKETTYILDISHNFERLTEQKKEKIKKVLSDFVEINNLNLYQRNILKGHLINYGIYIGLFPLMLRLFSNYKIFFIFDNLKLIRNNFKLILKK